MNQHEGRYVVPFEDLRMTDVESVGGKRCTASPAAYSPPTSAPTETCHGW